MVYPRTGNRPYRGEIAARRIMNGTAKHPRRRIDAINTERTASLSAAESQGRIRVQQENDAIRMEY